MRRFVPSIAYVFVSFGSQTAQITVVQSVSREYSRIRCTLGPEELETYSKRAESANGVYSSITA